MIHSKILQNGKIIEANGSVIDETSDLGNNKCFAVFAKCGHVGNGYYMPICFAVKAKNLEGAVKLTKEFPRVKRDSKHCIIGAVEVSDVEYYLLHYANDNDLYLNSNLNNQDVDSIQKRRIITTEALEDILAEDKTDKPLNRYRDVEIKTADQYEDYQILQRAFAPVLYGDKYMVPTRFNLRDVLREYYREIAIVQGILKKRSLPLVYYYELFGPNNELGIKYEDNGLKYVSSRGNPVYVPIIESSQRHLEIRENSNDFVLVEETEEEKVYEEPLTQSPRESAISKFNKRLAKTKELQKPRQPGEE